MLLDIFGTGVILPGIEKWGSSKKRLLQPICDRYAHIGQNGLS